MSKSWNVSIRFLLLEDLQTFKMSDFLVETSLMMSLLNSQWRRPVAEKVREQQEADEVSPKCGVWWFSYLFSMQFCFSFFLFRFSSCGCPRLGRTLCLRARLAAILVYMLWCNGKAGALTLNEGFVTASRFKLDPLSLSFVHLFAGSSTMTRCYVTASKPKPPPLPPLRRCRGDVSRSHTSVFLCCFFKIV